LSCYRKTTYKDEADDLVAAGYGYDFGDFKSYAPPELSKAMVVGETVPDFRQSRIFVLRRILWSGGRPWKRIDYYLFRALA
jgi:hypothetical protein